MKKLFVVVSSWAIFFAVSLSAQATPIATYESLERVNSNSVSFHNVTGPVLADDFIPSISGTVVSVEWWGTAPFGASDEWEITFHNNAAGVPAYTAPFGGISQHFAFASGTDGDSDGIYHYMTSWTPQDLFLSAGTNYWFSVANASGNGWTWAYDTTPTVGSETYLPVFSIGGQPDIIIGPHDGPWSRLVDDSFAFRINVEPVPEPTTMLLLGTGLVGVAGAARRKKKNQA